AGIAGGDESGVLINDKRDAGTESQRAGEEDVLLAVRAEDNGLPLRAMVHRVLNAGCGELLLVGQRDVAVAGSDVGLEGDARGRNFRLGDGARVLSGERNQGKEWKRSKKETSWTHEILQSAKGATKKQAGERSAIQWTDHLGPSKCIGAERCFVKVRGALPGRAPTAATAPAKASPAREWTAPVRESSAQTPSRRRSCRRGRGACGRRCTRCKARGQSWQ